ncbi:MULTISPECIES: hypothetical protein [unclassified Streptomyces]|uniref:hypothetical protein n=1 Tax=unclassified Streptomyces TaxID=2593676 RepID=UPI0033C857C3
MALNLGELVAGLRADDAPFTRSLTRAELAMRGLTRDVNGQLRDMHGRFVSEGEGMGRSFSHGIGRGARQAIAWIGKIGVAMAVMGAVSSAAALGAAGALALLPLAVIGLGAKILAENKQVAGAFSDLGKHVKSEMAQLAQPLVKPFVQAAAQLRKIFDQLAPQIGQAFAAVAPMIAPLVDGIGKFASGIMPGFVAALQSAQPVIEALSTGLGALGAGIGGFFEGVAGGSDGAASALDALLGAVGSLLPVVGQLLGALAKLGGPLLAGVIAAIEPLIGLAAQAANGLGVLVDKIPPGVLTAIGAAFVVVAIGVKTYTVAMGLAATATRLWAAAQALFNGIMAANPIGLVIAAVVALAAAFYIAYQRSETFRQVVATGWASIQLAISTAVAGIKAALNWFASLPGLVSGWFGSARDAAVAQLVGLLAWMRGVPGRAGAALGGLAASLRTATVRGFTALRSAAASQAATFLSWMRGLPRRISAAIGSLSGLLVSKGKDVIRGLLNGIKSMGGWLKGQLMSFAKSMIPGPIARALHIGSPSRLMADEIGHWIPPGIAMGAEANAGVLDRTMANLVSAPTPSAAIAMGAGTAGARAVGSSGTQKIVLEVNAGGGSANELIGGLIRDFVTVRGGNVQYVLGR